MRLLRARLLIVVIFGLVGIVVVASGFGNEIFDVSVVFVELANIFHCRH